MRLIQDGPPLTHCCMCGKDSQLKWCNACKHTFCHECRYKYFARGIEAVKELLGQSDLYCGGVHG